MAQMALTLQQMGVSDHSSYAMIGLNYETEQVYKATEAQDKLAALAKGQAMPPPNAIAPQVPTDIQKPNAGMMAQGQTPTTANPPPPMANQPSAVAQRAKLVAKK
jgi:hypothetical protein